MEDLFSTVKGAIILHEPDIDYEKLKRKDKLYYTRMMPKLGYYEIHEVKVSTHYTSEERENPYCTVSDIKSKQSYLLGKKYAELTLFTHRDKALEFIKQEQSKSVKRYNEIE